MHPVSKIALSALFSVALCHVFEFGIQSFLLASILAFFAFVYFDPEQDDKLPPGPIGLPIVGSLPWLLRDSNKYMMGCFKKYGNIFSLRLGNSLQVIINDYEMIKEFSNLSQTQDRPGDGIVRELAKGKGIVDADGDLWKHQRRFVLHCLRDSGMGKMNMDCKIKSETEKMIAYIEDQGGNPMSFRYILAVVTSSVICNLAFDIQLDYKDPKLVSLLKMMKDQFVLVGKLSKCVYFPWLRPFLRNKYRLAEENLDSIISTCFRLIDAHKKELDPDNPRDLIDLYLLEMQKEATEKDKEYLNTFTKEQLAYVTMNLFNAGTDTSSTTILWGLAFMALHPEVQQKVQAEIDDVLGTEATPSTGDKYNLPYTMAALQEIERCATIVPMGLQRSNKAPISFGGYLFPPDTTFNFNLHAVHHDPRLWKDPDVFNPDRFIKADGTVFRPSYLIPFGSGRRSCAGESLARTEIFIIFASLMQKFRFKIPDATTFKIGSSIGILNTIDDYKLEALPRHSK